MWTMNVGILMPFSHCLLHMVHSSCFMFHAIHVGNWLPSHMWQNYSWIQYIHYIYTQFHLLTFIFLLYFGLFTVIGSLISILRSVAPERRRKFDVIFCANDGLRLLIFAFFLHSFIITLESCSPCSLSVSSSFSANNIQNVICHFLFVFFFSFFLFGFVSWLSVSPEKAHAVS